MWRFIRTLRMNPRRRMYVITLVGLATMAWTVLFTGGLLLGVLPPQHVPGLCQFVVDADACNNHQPPHKFLPYSTVRPPSQRFSSSVIRPNGEQQQRRFRTIHNQENIMMQLRKPPSMTLMGNGSALQDNNSDIKPKVILRWTKFYGKDWGVPQGSHIFKELQCPHQKCVVTDEKSEIKEADAVLVHMRDIHDPSQLPHYRAPHQRWIMHTLESPYHSEVNLTKFNGLFNWTSTYSDESDIPCPYGEYVPSEFDKFPRGTDMINKDPPSPVTLRQKSRTAAWFVTNCKAQNKREWFIDELQKHIQVDVYGICGKLKCKDPAVCQDMLKQRYKFYIAFENSSCKQYITEKFWANSLQNDIVPVVMGAPAVDYEKYAPPHSFIHIDNFSSPRELARHLKILHKNVNLYSEYFKWKTTGSAKSYVNFKPTTSRFWCDLCTALHNDKLPRKTHGDLASWWSVEKQCKI